MPVPVNRTILPTVTRNFGRHGDTVDIPPLTDIQTISYKRFLQLEELPAEREAVGLEGVLKEIFPIKSYDGTISLDYIKYELGKPRFGPDECRQLRLTYGRPFRVWTRHDSHELLAASQSRCMFSEAAARPRVGVCSGRVRWELVGWLVSLSFWPGRPRSRRLCRWVRTDS